MARRSFAAAALPARLWPFAVLQFTFLLNRMPHAALDHADLERRALRPYLPTVSLVCVD